MQILTRLIALTRGVQLRRQFREVEKCIAQLAPTGRRQLAALAIREFSNASRSEFPHLYGTPPDAKYSPWGSGTTLGIERMKSDNLQVSLRGVALWLSVAFHETKDSPYNDQRELHRQVMRSLRTLKEAIPASEMSQILAQQKAA